jgi:EAL domain-containing protein (putative c-di-GMP-specific phosphodiesterase class I)/DNA-binding NarL/FixJ family response regulator
MNGDIWDDARWTPADEAAPPERSPLLDAKVMMVDDEPLMTDLIQAHLEEAGYANFVATNDPRETLELLRRERPGVLLLDLMMPQLSGFDVLAAIRADGALRFLPVIVLTAATGADAKLRALTLGATDFLAKPVDASELVLRVRNTLAFRQYHDRLINYDAVTGLPNQRLFERGVAGLLQARSSGHGCDGLIALFSITVPECRDLSERVDDDVANAFAREIQQRLERVAARENRRDDRPSTRARESVPTERIARVARAARDQFTLLVDGLPDAEAVEGTARRLVDALVEPVTLAAHELVPTAWIGIAVSPGDGDTPASLRQGAELAATHAREQGNTPFQFSSPALNKRSYARLTLGSQLRGAARRGELRLHYQPKLAIADDRILGAEALVRWQHPDHGLLGPGAFIGLAEEMGIVGQIGEWVLEAACADAAAWARAGLGLPRMAINVAKPQFAHGDLAAALRRAIEASGVAASRLVVELTESMLMEDVHASVATMKRIRDLGAALSIDDFGTGYSSLAYLKRFPVDELKVDRSFVTDLPGGRADSAIVRSIVELGHNLDMTVTAEGVETAAQLEALRTMGCDAYQGFLYSRPIPAEQFARLLGGDAGARSPL